MGLLVNVIDQVMERMRSGGVEPVLLLMTSKARRQLIREVTDPRLWGTSPMPLFTAGVGPGPTDPPWGGAMPTFRGVPMARLEQTEEEGLEQIVMYATDPRGNGYQQTLYPVNRWKGPKTAGAFGIVAEWEGEEEKSNG